MTLRHAFPITLALAFALAGNATAAGTKGNAVAGKQKAAACAACHGADGNQTLDGTYPRLAGQYADYLAKALTDYKTGKRKNTVMQGQVQALEQADIDDLAAYYASLEGEVHDLSRHVKN
jgi:cytochrome c553